jgi:hypothetical protein
MLPESLFVSSTVHAREIQIGCGATHVLYFKELPAVKFAAFQEAKNSPNEVVREGAIAKLIVASLCAPDGSPAVDATVTPNVPFGYERALTLKPGVLNEIMKHILEINGYGADSKKE